MVKKKQNIGAKGKKGKIKDLKLRKDTVKRLTDTAASTVKGGGYHDSFYSCLKCELQ
jgi:hypothetical protein